MTHFALLDQFYFWQKVNKNGGYVDFTDPLISVNESHGECWIWTGTGNQGYGKFRSRAFGNTVVGAHRVSYFLETGVLSTRADPVDHRCRNRLCVRPGHLERVSFRDNIHRGSGPTAINAGKTYCVWGHEFTPENTMPNGKSRKCRTCHRRISTQWARDNRKNRAK